MAVLAGEARRAVSRRGIEQGARREARTGPPLVIPGPVRDPSAGRARLREAPELFGELLLVPGVTQIDGEQVEAAHRHVGVRVDEAGHDAPAAPV